MVSLHTPVNADSATPRLYFLLLESQQSEINLYFFFFQITLNAYSYSNGYWPSGLDSRWRKELQNVLILKRFVRRLRMIQVMPGLSVVNIYVAGVSHDITADSPGIPLAIALLGIQSLPSAETHVSLHAKFPILK